MIVLYWPGLDLLICAAASMAFAGMVIARRIIYTRVPIWLSGYRAQPKDERTIWL